MAPLEGQLLDSVLRTTVQSLAADCTPHGSIRSQQSKAGFTADKLNSAKVALVKAKFHYTDPTGPAPTRTDPHGLCLVGSGQARVVEFSLYATATTRVHWSRASAS